MKEIYLSRNLLESMVYSFDDLEDPVKNLSDYDYIKEEKGNTTYYLEYSEDITCYDLDNIKEAYKQIEQIFKEIEMLETGNEIEYCLYSGFGENSKVSNIFCNYMDGKEKLAKIKAFWLVLDHLNQ